MVFSLTILIEAFVEYKKSIWRMFADKQYKTAITQLCAIAVSVFICLLSGIDIFKGMGIGSKVLCEVLTGIVISRGSNYVSDLLKKLGNGNNQ